MLVLAAVGVAILAGLWGLGVTYRVRSQRSGPIVQAGIFVAMFLSTGQVPVEIMTGWLQWVAERNPFTYILQMARQGFLDDISWSNTWPGLLSIVGLGAVLGLFTWRGFRRLVP
jgi:ABC-type polysaccharide/polyol phosphate export permease